MLFHTLTFLVFFVSVFAIYWGAANRNLRLRNAFVLAASYLFYGWWDWRFLILIVISSGIDYCVGLLLESETDQQRRRIYLGTSLAGNLGLLGIFKYFGFFVESFTGAFAEIGVHLNPITLQIALPVGISFYTFQSLSYTIDVYRRRQTPTHDIVGFFAFVAFFPQLVAGPIERARNLLPQFERLTEFDPDKARDACRQILWGLFKKVVIADGLAPSVDWIFQEAPHQNGTTLVIGAVFFAFQIYCDFSGYSDMAIGLARLLGFDLKQNFRTPYFSRNIGEFWRRWHISLSTWFRDYVFIPLGGNDPERFKQAHPSFKHIRNILITFMISGLWHGAQWKFVVWGAFHGLLYLSMQGWRGAGETQGAVAATGPLAMLRNAIQIFLTFALVTASWIIFRADTLSDAWLYLSVIVSEPWFTQGIPTPNYNSILYSSLRLGLLSIGFLLIIEWPHREKAHGLALSNRIPTLVRWLLYCLIIGLIIRFSDSVQPFIYFQF